ncbi:MAG: signal recognition particle protein Srp19 [Candidatus Thermoplasmatota archaeon]|nr:signal recognition particle protein Srp19 [Euryarchaeota archaeon]MBU4032105.1 signal recognition particle protein Srp19 [Candidatus Thermoplasmatota archaeon]MBU4071269.1 signal recognition particle protein Srp19 [Candidatus Thermoplasmatota archaeon]MBU4144871.1 signal recognition particle protein Srp19 [Candidatus Thermoplasmatota archaeon]MBU4592666.1 signal recognition particle protein Srp19 [Candidatus Thermoplasmatota archaeon]
MVRTRTDHIILWPSYFDSTKSRARGRRVPKALAIQNPTSAELLDAVKSLGLEAELNEDKSYPAFWWNREGCVSVEKSLSKTELIGKVAPVLKQLRQ